MSRREIKVCDTVNEAGVCNREASGTCALCEKDFCPVHVSASYATVRAGIGEAGKSTIAAAGGWIDIQPCSTCADALRRALNGSSPRALVHLLPTHAQFVEALRAVLASETLKGDAG